MILLLRKCKKHKGLKDKGRLKKMIYVLGHNYAYTDLDSIVSSIVLAEILNKKGCLAKPVVINPSAIGQESIDIINHIGELALPELVSINEIIKNDIALVDHNNPMESYGAHISNMAHEGVHLIDKTPVICIDHHVDAGYPAKIKIIERVGSTCTILTEIIKKENIKLSGLLARALVFGIACDTKGLKSRKTSDRDREMIEYLYNTYKIGTELENVLNFVLTSTNVLNMTTDQILRNSLKEYCGGSIGIACIEVLNDDYMQRLEEIKKAASKTKYPLFILMIFRQHEGETVVYYFSKKPNLFPKMQRYDDLISRAQDLVPYVLDRLKKEYAKKSG